MAIKIYHNPRCSKSRKTLELIQGAGVEPEIVLYLQDTPSAAEIAALAKSVGQPLANLLRRGETEFKDATDLPDLADDQALAGWLTAHPIVLERPVVIDTETGKGVMGRPPENVAELL